MACGSDDFESKVVSFKTEDVDRLLMPPPLTLPPAVRSKLKQCQKKSKKESVESINDIQNNNPTLLNSNAEDEFAQFLSELESETSSLRLSTPNSLVNSRLVDELEKFEGTPWCAVLDPEGRSIVQYYNSESDQYSDECPFFLKSQSCVDVVVESSAEVVVGDMVTKDNNNRADDDSMSLSVYDEIDEQDYENSILCQEPTSYSLITSVSNPVEQVNVDGPIQLDEGMGNDTKIVKAVEPVKESIEISTDLTKATTAATALSINDRLDAVQSTNICDTSVEGSSLLMEYNTSTDDVMILPSTIEHEVKQPPRRNKRRNNKRKNFASNDIFDSETFYFINSSVPTNIKKNSEDENKLSPSSSSHVKRRLLVCPTSTTMEQKITAFLKDIRKIELMCPDSWIPPPSTKLKANEPISEVRPMDKRTLLNRKRIGFDYDDNITSDIKRKKRVIYDSDSNDQLLRTAASPQVTRSGAPSLGVLFSPYDEDSGHNNLKNHSTILPNNTVEEPELLMGPVHRISTDIDNAEPEMIPVRRRRRIASKSGFHFRCASCGSKAFKRNRIPRRQSPPQQARVLPVIASAKPASTKGSATIGTISGLRVCILSRLANLWRDVKLHERKVEISHDGDYYSIDIIRNAVDNWRLAMAVQVETSMRDWNIRRQSSTSSSNNSSILKWLSTLQRAIEEVRSKLKFLSNEYDSTRESNVESLMDCLWTSVCSNTQLESCTATTTPLSKQVTKFGCDEFLQKCVEASTAIVLSRRSPTTGAIGDTSTLLQSKRAVGKYIYNGARPITVVNNEAVEETVDNKLHHATTSLDGSRTALKFALKNSTTQPSSQYSKLLRKDDATVLSTFNTILDDFEDGEIVSESRAADECTDSSMMLTQAATTKLQQLKTLDEEHTMTTPENEIANGVDINSKLKKHPTEVTVRIGSEMGNTSMAKHQPAQQRAVTICRRPKLSPEALLLRKERRRLQENQLLKRD